MMLLFMQFCQFCFCSFFILLLTFMIILSLSHARAYVLQEKFVCNMTKICNFFIRCIVTTVFAILLVYSGATVWVHTFNLTYSLASQCFDCFFCSIMLFCMLFYSCLPRFCIVGRGQGYLYLTFGDLMFDQFSYAATHLQCICIYRSCIRLRFMLCFRVFTCITVGTTHY